MLIQIDYTVLNTDRITKITVDPDGKYVIVYFSENDFERFEFPDHESQDRFLNKIGLKTYFA
ncbi:hypothetical protein VXN68_04090 [Acinetobacter schindleri]|uniref:hypothetical protein n=1 Tax=Acinetobacter schindleri TaxID=108981 RepID=UPI003A890491